MTSADTELSEESTPTSKAELVQARAWYLATGAPWEKASWQEKIDNAYTIEDQLEAFGDHVLEADPEQDAALEAARRRSTDLEREVIELWRNRNDDELSPGRQHHVQRLQAEAWLEHTDRRRWKDWSEAHGFAANQEERHADEELLLQLWHTATGKGLSRQDALEASTEFGDTANFTRADRERRLGRAENWLRHQDPQRYYAFNQQRSYADSIADEHKDNQKLVREYLAATDDQWVKKPIEPPQAKGASEAEPSHEQQDRRRLAQRILRLRKQPDATTRPTQMTHQPGRGISL